MKALVLTFHDISDHDHVLSYPIDAFEHLLQEFGRHNVPVVDFDTLRRGGGGVTLTFDDGFASVHRVALPALRARGYPAHLFAATGSIGRAERWPVGAARPDHLAMLDWQQLEDCHHGGVTIEAHTVDHPDLCTLDRDAIVDQCQRANETIAARLGRAPRLFAYPFGRFNTHVVRAAAPLYSACFTTRMGYWMAGSDSARVPRIDSYYLRSRWLRQNLLGTGADLYLRMRGLVRQILGRT
ncbi:MAG: polysaccharide deacetylase family protein [Steroidobacteraceae bacterium]